MTLLEDIVPLDLLLDMIDSGYIRTQAHPDDSRYVILNYTEKAQFEKVWNAATRECRGLIVKCWGFGMTGAEVLARPFAKFFNLSEHNSSEFDPEAWVYAHDKMDGSLGILYPAPDGRAAIATRGSFASPQALHATALYRERYEGKWHPVPYNTYLFEIIFPENRIVLDYGSKDDLVLLGQRHVVSGMVRPPSYGAAFAGWPGPRTANLYHGTLRGALALQDRPNAEGVVIQIVGSGALVKVKQEDYVALHRIVFGLNERAVWEHLSSGKGLNEMIEGLPDEFHDWVAKVGARLINEHQRIVHQCAVDLMSAKNAVRLQYMIGEAVPDAEKDPRGYRAALSDYVRMSTYPGVVWKMFDGKDYSAAVWKMQYPAHSTFAKTHAEDVAA